MTTLKILGIHGLGDHRQSPWKRDWQDVLRTAIPNAQAMPLEFRFFEYDRIFEAVEISFTDSLKALYKLAQSGVSHWRDESPQEGRFGVARAEGVFDSVRDKLRWTAGYVVAWVENEVFRTQLRAEFLDMVAREKPDVILAHSLGSLICYDALISRDVETNAALKRHLQKSVTFVSLGSQIANAFVIGNLTGGRVMPLPVSFWFHLYNSEDDVFTAPISLPGVPNFRQVQTYFDIPGWADHDATQYLKHAATVHNVWSSISAETTGQRGFLGRAASEDRAEFREESQWRKQTESTRRGAARKALLIGISEYPNPLNRLYGCVNDVFLMSSLLQENGFRADDIRIVLNHRATAEGIRSRMKWLMEDAVPGDQLVFYFSGHGAQMPSYNAEEIVDHCDETLVPYDFDWSPERAVIDDQIVGLYSQLHFDTRLTMIFDCCHSGGMHRDGGPTVRGVTPPDDIRHRAIRWDSERQIWAPRPFAEVSSLDDLSSGLWWEQNRVHRLGRAAMLRESVRKDSRIYDQNRKLAESLDVGLVGNNVGHAPYLPLILEACHETEFAYEYRHGAESYGAFTYMLAKRLRQKDLSKPNQNVSTLLKAIAMDLSAAGRTQHPQFCGPNPLPQVF